MPVPTGPDAVVPRTMTEPAGNGPGSPNSGTSTGDPSSYKKTDTDPRSPAMRTMTGESAGNSGRTSVSFKEAASHKEATLDFVAENVQATHNAYSALGTAQVLKAFRAIGGLDGVEESELRMAFRGLRNETLKKEVEGRLSEIFAKHDVHNAGTLDILEFEQMIMSSALLEKAVYELLDMQTENEEHMFSRGVKSGQEQLLEVVSAGAILLNCLVMTVSTDNDPDWRGWQMIELGFTAVFVLEIAIRYKLAKNMADYLSYRMNIFDIMVTLLVGAEVALTLFVEESESWNILFLFRVVRLVRLGRLIKVISYCKELVCLLEGLATSFRSVLWSFLLLGLLVFLWAMIIRQCIMLNWVADEDGSLKGAFKSVPESMLILFRCWALSADGACQNSDGVPLFQLLGSIESSTGVQWVFKLVWFFCEGFVYVGILNVVASTFVVNAIHVEQQVEELVALSPDLQSRNHLLLRKLDKLLRTLTHPGKKHVTPKDRNVAKVASLIHEEYPDAAAKMPDMCKMLVEFSENIQTALSTHCNAMTPYEADEVKACRDLHSMPSAKSYLVDGEEKLMVSPNCALGPSASMNIGVAPTGAVEVKLVQESTELEVLLEEAKELHKHMRSRIAISGGTNCGHHAVFCNELTDPGPKGRDRIKQKVESKYGGRWERNRDYARLGLIYNSVEGLMKALKNFLNCSISSSEGMEVVCIENRFAEPSRLGWRDLQILLKVRVPSTGRHHIMEIQLNLRGLSDVRDATHGFYKKIRAVLPEDAVAVVIDQLTSNTTLDLDITQQEWLECLKNAEVDQILNDLKIPTVIRRNAIDIVDADGSGSVSTAELREGLLLCCGNLSMSGGVVDCKLKVKEIQQWLRNKIEPQLRLIQNMLLNANSERTNIESLLLQLAENVPGAVADQNRSTDRTRASAFGDEFLVQHQMSPDRNGYLVDRELHPVCDTTEATGKWL